MRKINSFFGLVILLTFVYCSPKISPDTNQETVQEQKPVEEEIEIPIIEEEEVEEVEELKRILVASIKKTACFGKCPVFEAQLFSDGEVIYKGRQYVKKVGTYSSVVDETMVQSVIGRAQKMDYFSLKDKYPTTGRMIKDIPNTITSVNDGNQQLKIMNNHDAPKRLQEFETFLLNFFEELEYTMISK